jgi:hypothetical protein
MEVCGVWLGVLVGYLWGFKVLFRTSSEQFMKSEDNIFWGTPATFGSYSCNELERVLSSWSSLLSSTAWDMRSRSSVNRPNESVLDSNDSLTVKKYWQQALKMRWKAQIEVASICCLNFELPQGRSHHSKELTSRLNLHRFQTTWASRDTLVYRWSWMSSLPNDFIER